MWRGVVEFNSFISFYFVNKIDRMEKREITGVQGQVNNIEVIFKEYYGSLCYFASQFLKNEEVIEDLVQDVFIALLEKIYLAGKVVYRW